MKKSLAFVAAVVLLAGVAIAQAPAEAISLPAKNGNVSFNHKSHAALKCEACHPTAKGGDIAGIGADLDKEKAHAACLDCHKKEAKGPQKCADCHKK